MHSHGRTLIASLGFADPDKANPVHDLACQYIASDGINASAWDLVAEEVGPWVDSQPCDVDHDDRCDHKKVTSQTTGWRWTRHSGWTERPTSSRTERVLHSASRSLSVVGFIDCIRKYEFTVYEDGTCIDPIQAKSSYLSPTYDGDYRPYTNEWRAHVDACFEVKIDPVPIGQIIRQVNFYRSHQFASLQGKNGEGIEIRRRLRYLSSYFWWVVTAYDVTSAGEDELAAHNIGILRLGDGFDRWRREQALRDLAEDRPPPRVI